MRHDSIKVSVIIPSYNSASTILQAIESVFNQTFREIEIVVVDDGSTDDTRSILEPLVQAGRIVYLYQDNAGCGAARNRGIGVAKGEYVALLDADDYWHAEKIGRQVKVLEENKNCVMCYTESYMVDPYSDLVWETMHGVLGRPRSGKLLPYLAFHNMITLSSAMVRTETLKKTRGFTEDYGLMMFADYDLWLRLAPLGEIVAITVPMTFYRTRSAPSREVITSNLRKILRVFVGNFWREKRVWYLVGCVFCALKLARSHFVAIFAKLK